MTAGSASVLAWGVVVLGRFVDSAWWSLDWIELLILNL
jgi:hypothetical protein